ncbi:hypothetical protein Bca52824_065487 [Brassica carinata]|uniref:Uncharacterized protein n=1 Tax=Brassica carinata TaxID=52824 RepID=A0A8X7U9P5_BRACI|nr:hypothetical protein Bca52824_065487 [Brassica carinata]
MLACPVVTKIFNVEPPLNFRGGNGGLGDDLNGGSSTQVQSKNAYPIAKISMLMLNTIDRILLENGKRQVMYMLQQFGRS